MTEVQQNVDLLPYNTFNLSARAKYFTTVTTVDETRAVIRSPLFRQHKHLIIGGGSNILLTGDYDGLVIRNALKGIHVIEESDEHVTIEAASGERWHDLVMYCVARDYGGIENLSLIPGTVGAAPMQNIGAYGREVRDVIRTVEALSLETGELMSFTNEACAFGYRESIFKHEMKNRCFISSITLTLTRKNHRFNTSYGAIEELLKHKGEVSVRTISEAVIEIRTGKLPDPGKIGNAGSFFKNPSIPHDRFEALREKFPAIPSFPGENHMVKVPAAWLIEQCGWKGKTFGNIGVHKHQALVLVNYGGGEGKELLALSKEIQQTVEEKFGIKLHPEVNVV